MFEQQNAHEVERPSIWASAPPTQHDDSDEPADTTTGAGIPQDREPVDASSAFAGMYDSPSGTKNAPTNCTRDGHDWICGALAPMPIPAPQPPAPAPERRRHGGRRHGAGGARPGR